MYCNQCGRDNAEDAQFCQGCGRPLVREPIPVSAPTPRRATYNPTGKPAPVGRIMAIGVAVLVAGCIVLAAVGSGSSRSEASRNPRLLLDDSWKLKTVFALALISNLADEVEKMEPPESLEDVHRHYRAGARKYKEMTAVFVEGMDHVDVAKFQRAVQLLNEGSESVQKATAAVQRFQSDHG